MRHVLVGGFQWAFLGGAALAVLAAAIAFLGAPDDRRADAPRHAPAVA